MPTRTTLPYTPHPDQNRFLLPSGGARTYGSQFFSMYMHRSAKMIPRAFDEAVAKWGQGDQKMGSRTIKHQQKILDITGGQLCWVVGTVFVEMKGKLDILRDVENGMDDILPEAPREYGSFEGECEVTLEDESGRAILAGDYVKTANLVTGCVVGILGIEVKAGVFEVMDVVFPSIPNEPVMAEPEKPFKIAFVSGLRFTENPDNIKLDLLRDLLTGQLEGAEQISRVVILGDSIASLPAQQKTNSANFGSKNVITYDPRALVQLDQWIHELALSVPVSIMPGANDPAEICLPQQPLHRAFLHSTLPISGNGRVDRLTNPQWIQEGPLNILCTAGQNVDDVKKYTGNSLSSIDVMERHLRWQHIAPTAPDTLYCYAYINDDPFILETMPNVYVVGNQDRYEKGTFKGTAMLSVPRFSERGEFVVYSSNGESEVVRIE